MFAVKPVVGKLRSQTVNEYSDVVFECDVVAGVPKPSVQWWVNGTILADEENKVRYFAFYDSFLKLYLAKFQNTLLAHFLKVEVFFSNKSFNFIEL